MSRQLSPDTHTAPAGAAGRSRSFPLGATVKAGGVNFSVYSKSCTAMELLLFDGVDDRRAEPGHLPRLRGATGRAATGTSSCRGSRADSSTATGRTARSTPPAGTASTRRRCWSTRTRGRSPCRRGTTGLAAILPGDNAGSAMKSVVVDRRGYDWEGDRPLRHSFAKTIIYELHVAGFTRHPSSGVPAARRGTYAGLIEKIPYLVGPGDHRGGAAAGLPVRRAGRPAGQEELLGLRARSPSSRRTPATARARDPLGPLDEFRDLVKALHRADIEVILDVVYNHTTEVDEGGPTLSLRGLENSVYYMLEPDKERYANYTGTGNTLNANHSIVRRMIIDSLHYWAEEMHVDGFRFDLASILSRDDNGRADAEPAGDLGHRLRPGPRRDQADRRGLGRRGPLPGRQLRGRHLDGVERAVPRRRAGFRQGGPRHGSPGRRAAAGQPGHLRPPGARPGAEHQLRDLPRRVHAERPGLVTTRKHNADNGEDNRDGTDDNLSWNCGVEGPAGDPEVERLRNRQVKNFLALTLLSFGTPMLLMGDEMRRTQRGNNNAYCQDNEISWLDWRLLERHDDLRRFVRRLIDFRLRRDLSGDDPSLTLNQLLSQARVHWHGVRLNEPDWGEQSHSVAATLENLSGMITYHLILNAWHDGLEFELPRPAAGEEGWRRLMDTGLEGGAEISRWGEAVLVRDQRYLAGPRSIVLLGSARPGLAATRTRERG